MPCQANAALGKLPLAAFAPFSAWTAVGQTPVSAVVADCGNGLGDSETPGLSPADSINTRDWSPFEALMLLVHSLQDMELNCDIVISSCLPPD